MNSGTSRMIAFVIDGRTKKLRSSRYAAEPVGERDFVTPGSGPAGHDRRAAEADIETRFSITETIDPATSTRLKAPSTAPWMPEERHRERSGRARRARFLLNAGDDGCRYLSMAPANPSRAPPAVTDSTSTPFEMEHEARTPAASGSWVTISRSCHDQDQAVEQIENLVGALPVEVARRLSHSRKVGSATIARAMPTPPSVHPGAVRQ